MTKSAALLLLVGALLLVGGVAAFDWRVGLCLAGVLAIAAGVLSLDRTPRAQAAHR